MSFSIDLQTDDMRWRKARGLTARLRRSAELALKRGNAAPSSSLTILLTDDARLCSLNYEFRGTNQPTNVLSFVSHNTVVDYLGDVALAFGVTTKEARSARIRFIDHAMHLTVHGVLHLLGFDHQTRVSARVMERLEARILGELGVEDPYADVAAT